MSGRRGSYVPRNNLTVTPAADTQVEEPRPPVPVVPRPSPIGPFLCRLAKRALFVLVALAVLASVWINVPGLSYAGFGCCIVALAGFWAAHRRGENQSCFMPPFPAETCHVSLAAAVVLRTRLRRLFPSNLAPSSWVDLSGVDLSVFGYPKGVDTDMPLLWTSQTEVLWCELSVKPRGNVFRGQILAGPSGIGKSHIALLLALRCYALGMPVLYVPDAGKPLGDCITHPRSLVIHWQLDAVLLYSFAMLNLDVVPTALLSLVGAKLFPAFMSFRRLLHRCNAVVVLDEHGHAYDLLAQSAPHLVPTRNFPLLMPNSYLDNLNVRCVFAGSNQARFECELNETYKPCLRYVVPFERHDAVTFLVQLYRRAPSDGVLAQCERWANFVPGEMVKLLHADSVDAYVAQRREEIADKLWRMLDSLGARYFNMVRTLDNLFGESSMAMGTEPYSFLDFGYVYRRASIGAPVGYGHRTAHPLCFPATLALMDLLSISSRPATMRLTQIVRECNGPGFENLSWHVLLARGFLDGATLPCRRLGAGRRTNSATAVESYRLFRVAVELWC